MAEIEPLRISSEAEPEETPIQDSVEPDETAVEPDRSEAVLAVIAAL